jgi:hypothetical protein
MDEEVWLRRLLDACHKALEELRQRDLPRLHGLVTDLEAMCARIQQKLDAAGDG